METRNTTLATTKLHYEAHATILYTYARVYFRGTLAPFIFQVVPVCRL